MRAYSQRTETMYEGLVAAEANGWTVIIIMRTESPNGKRARTFARAVGPFPDKKTAARNQARLRRRFRRGVEKVPGTEVVAVTVEPLGRSWDDTYLQHHALRHPEIAALREQINSASRTLEGLAREHRLQERQRIAKYEGLLLARRPAYPTEEHLSALNKIARLVHAGLPYGDHLGYPRPEDRQAGIELPHSVDFCSQDARVNIYAHAPYAAGSTRRLWQFTSNEIAELREHLRSLSMSIVSEWAHDDGVAFVVAPRRV